MGVLEGRQPPLLPSLSHPHTWTRTRRHGHADTGTRTRTHTLVVPRLTSAPDPPTVGPCCRQEGPPWEGEELRGSLTRTGRSERRSL